MAKKAKPTHEVSHDRMYMMVNGKLQHVKKGTQLTLSEKQAKKAGGKLHALGNSEHLDLSPDSTPEDL